MSKVPTLTDYLDQREAILEEWIERNETLRSDIQVNINNLEQELSEAEERLISQQEELLKIKGIKNDTQQTS